MNRQAVARIFNKVLEKLALETVEDIVLDEEASAVLHRRSEGVKTLTFYVKPNVFEKIQKEQLDASLPTNVRGEEVLTFMGHRFVNRWPGDENVTIVSERGNISVMKP